LSAQARVLRGGSARSVLFVAVAAGAAVPRAANAGGIRHRRAGPRPSGPDERAGEGEVVVASRFSSARLPALSLDAPDGWTLAWTKGRKLSASGDGARLLISSAS
jgi:hypothetical protein